LTSGTFLSILTVSHLMAAAGWLQDSSVPHKTHLPTLLLRKNPTVV
jgi:hypothetical protein